MQVTSDGKRPDGHATWAHKQAIDFANKYADPILEPGRHSLFYWQVLAGYGYRPYVPYLV